MLTEWRVIVGDVRERLAELPDASVQCVVTSPPYWGLRDYGTVGQIGVEQAPSAYVAAMTAVCEDVRRVLRADGTLWLNLGDSYQNAKGQAHGVDPKQPARRHGLRPQDVSIPGLKPKDLVGIPWMVAFALRGAGWYLRADIVWSKPNPMPESVTDRPTKAHEYVFLLSKSRRYYYDADAIRQPYAPSTLREFADGYQGQATKAYDGSGAQNASDVKRRIVDKQRGHGRRHAGFNDRWDNMPKDEQQMTGSNARSVWTIATQPYPDAHFATFPEALPEKCIKAGTKPGDTVLDPFCGAGTTGKVAVQLARNFIGIELNPAYADLARKRIGGVVPLFRQQYTRRGKRLWNGEAGAAYVELGVCLLALVLGVALLFLLCEATVVIERAGPVNDLENVVRWWGQDTSIPVLVHLIEPIAVVNHGDYPQPVIASALQNFAQARVSGGRDRYPECHFLARKEEHLVNACVTEGVRLSRRWGDRPAEIATQGIAGSAPTISNTHINSDRQRRGRDVSAIAIWRMFRVHLNALVGHRNIGAFNLPIRGQHGISGGLLTIHDGALAIHDLVLRFEQVVLSEQQPYLESDSNQLQKPNKGSDDSEATGPVTVGRLLCFLALFFGGFGISLRGWLHLDDNRHRFTAAWIGCGWLLSAAGTALFLTWL